MNYLLLSKTISHALRHEPERYTLSLGENGWVSIQDLINGIQQVCPEYGVVTRAHVEKAVNSSDKKRHEINGGMIRALYGHSKEVMNDFTATQPPEILYHGTTVGDTVNILQEGIKKMSRQYVHLSSSIEDAIVVAKRRKKEVNVLTVDAALAFKEGVEFFNGGSVWLCDYIPAKYIVSQ